MHRIFEYFAYPEEESLSAAPARGVALVTRRATVDIPIHVWVLEVGGIVAAMFVTIRARELRVVSRNQVARRALAIRVAVIDGELRVIRVIEPRRGAPRARVVAARACRCEDRGIQPRRVRWTGGVVVIVLVAADTRRRQSRVVAVDVAIGALPGRHDMRTGQGKSSVVVIEG